ncbi:MAG: hypothetical protein JEZ14_02600 [Marinilabiliaceae bacterium]|nr:hypothetical protein [Marinilabiliaceae bacterium]
MFDKLMEKIENLFLDEPAVNIFSFGDPVAEKVEWTPLKNSGSSFRTQQVKAYGYNRIEIVPTIEVKLLGLLYIVADLAFVFWLLYSKHPDFQFMDDYKSGIFTLVFIASAIMGIVLYVKFFKRQNFDKQSGYYWVGKKGPRQTYDFKEDERFIELRTIHAIQLVKHLVKSDGSTFYSYELNLVLNNLKRVNVMNHGKLNKLREDAEALSKFLNVPVWDAIQ